MLERAEHATYQPMVIRSLVRHDLSELRSRRPHSAVRRNFSRCRERRRQGKPHLLFSHNSRSCISNHVFRSISFLGLGMVPRSLTREPEMWTPRRNSPIGYESGSRKISRYIPRRESAWTPHAWARANSDLSHLRFVTR